MLKVPRELLDAWKPPTELTLGSLLILAGLTASSFGFTGTLVALIQFAVFHLSEQGKLKPQPSPALADAFNALSWLLLLNFPFLAISGLVLALAGQGLRSGSLFARRVAQCAAAYGYVWIVCFSLSTYWLMPRMDPINGLRNVAQPTRSILECLGIVVNGVLLGAGPTILLVLLRKRRASSPPALSSKKSYRRGRRG